MIWTSLAPGLRQIWFKRKLLIYSFLYLPRIWLIVLPVRLSFPIALVKNLELLYKLCRLVTGLGGNSSDFGVFQQVNLYVLVLCFMDSLRAPGTPRWFHIQSHVFILVVGGIVENVWCWYLVVLDITALHAEWCTACLEDWNKNKYIKIELFVFSNIDVSKWYVVRIFL